MRSGNKGMLPETVYMLAVNNTPTIKKAILHPCKFHYCRTWCQVLRKSPNSTCTYRMSQYKSLYRIGTCVANTKLQDPVENYNFLQHSKCENVDTCSSARLFVLSLYGIKARNFFHWTNYDISWPRQTCFTVDTNRRCLQVV
jgi:hypothetical protein